MTRMFLAVPRDPVVPEGHTVTFLPDGTMIDMTQDARCGTCKWWLADDDANYCAYLATRTDEDFGCTAWEKR